MLLLEETQPLRIELGTFVLERGTNGSLTIEPSVSTFVISCPIFTKFEFSRMKCEILNLKNWQTPKWPCTTSQLHCRFKICRFASGSDKVSGVVTLIKVIFRHKCLENSIDVSFGSVWLSVVAVSFSSRSFLSWSH